MNGRPRDMEAFTPNHLLLLRSGPSAPPGLFSKDEIYSRRRWRQVQYLADIFWRRWIKEYLPSLQERQKWNRPRRNFAVDDIVLVADPSCPRSCWPIGRILDVHRNTQDGLCAKSNDADQRIDLTTTNQQNCFA